MNNLLISYSGCYESFIGWHAHPEYAGEFDDLLRDYSIVPFINHLTVNAGTKPPLEDLEPNKISYFGDIVDEETCEELKDKINEQIRRYIKENECEPFEVTKIISQ